MPLSQRTHVSGDYGKVGMLREITPLGENDFMYVADRHKKEFDYPIHIHDVLELNFVANATGARRVVGDSSEVIDNLDLVLITSPDLEHVWEQHECKSEDIHEVTVQFRLNFDLTTSPFRFNSYKSIYNMLIRAQRGLAFPPQAIMLVYHRLVRLSSIEEGFLAVQEFFSILYELSKFDNARELATSSFAKVGVESESERILKVKNYIDKHYKEELSLEQLAALVGMTPTAFSRYKLSLQFKAILHIEPIHAIVPISVSLKVYIGVSIKIHDTLQIVYKRRPYTFALDFRIYADRSQLYISFSLHHRLALLKRSEESFDK